MLVTTDKMAGLPRLTKDELQQHRTALEQWQGPDEVLRRTDELMSYMGSEDFFNQPGVEFIREAWAAAKFGAARGVEAVRLVRADELWPDFETRLEGCVQHWEFTEADVPSRRRGMEYRHGKPRAGDYIAQIEQAPEAIRRSCTAKAAKRYAGRAALLVYLNIPSFGARQQETLESFPESTAPAKHAFTEIWALWNDRAYGIWRHGVAFAT